MGVPTGEIVKIEPAALAPGLPVTLRVDYDAFYPAIAAAVGWRTRLIGELDSLRCLNVDLHAGQGGNRIGETVMFNGLMPKHAISGFLQLEKLPDPIYGFLPFPYGSVEVLDNKRFTIHIPQEITPVTPKPPATSPGPWPDIPTLPALPTIEGETLGVPNKWLLYAGIGIAIAALLYFLVFRGKGGKK